MLASFKFRTLIFSVVLFNLSLITEYSWGGVIARYSFDNSTVSVSGRTINDLSGNAYNGSFTTNVTSGQSGQFGQSFFFDGTDLGSEVRIPFATAAKFGNNFTFSYWINVAATNLSNSDYILHRGTTNTNQNALIFGYNTATSELFAPARSGTDPRSASGIPSIQAGVWNHIAYTYDGVTLRNYLNCVQTNATVITFDLTVTGDLSIGSAGNINGVGGANFRGYLDEFSIWNEALSSVQVCNLYNFNSVSVPEPSSIALWSVMCLASVSIKLMRRKGGILRSAI